MTATPEARTLLTPSVLDNPYPFYDALLSQTPVWHVPKTQIVVVTGYREVEEACRRVDDFSSKITSVLYRKRNRLPGRLSQGRQTLQVLATADPPLHSKHKQAVSRHFSAKNVAAVQKNVSHLADQRIATALKKRNVDFMRDVANPIPMQVISDLVGFRQGNQDKLLQAAFDSTAVVSGSSSLLHLAWCLFRSYSTFRWAGAQLRSAHEESDTILGSIKRRVAAGDLNETEATAFLLLFLAAGGESTTSLLGSAVQLLASDQALQTTLREQPERVPAFVEEVLRLESPFRYHLRSTAKPTSLGGVEIAPNTTVLLFWAAANRDPAVFENPHQLDLERPRKHLGFGRGIHTCIGAALARLEATIVLQSLLEQTSSITPVAKAPPIWVRSLQVRRYRKLPVTLTPK